MSATSSRLNDRAELLGAVDLAGLFAELVGPPRGKAWPCPSPTHAQTGKSPPVSIFDGRDGGQRWVDITCREGS